MVTTHSSIGQAMIPSPPAALGRGSTRSFAVSPPIAGFSTWDLDTQGDLAFENLTTTASSYTLTARGYFAFQAMLWGQGAQTKKGGYASGEILVSEGDVIVVALARGGGAAGGTTTGLALGKKGGGLTGIFITSITRANAVLVAGGAGAESHSANPGADGGGLAGADATIFGDVTIGGKGGNQSAGGAAAMDTGSQSEGEQPGAELTGGAGGADDTDTPDWNSGWGGGGGGGGGYFGGGGGLGGGASANGGGAGSGHAAAAVNNPVLEVGGGRANPRRNTGGDSYVSRAVLF